MHFQFGAFNCHRTFKRDLLCFLSAASSSERPEGSTQPAGVCAVHPSLERASGPSLQGRTQEKEGKCQSVAQQTNVNVINSTQLYVFI